MKSMMQLLCISATLLPAMIADAAEYTVTGTVKTSTGTKAGCNQLVKYVRVDVWDDDGQLNPDDFLGTTYTDDEGKFSLSFSMTIENPDVYVDIIYEFKAPDGKRIYVWRPNGTVYNSDLESEVVNDISPGTTDLGTLHALSNRPNMGTHAAMCMWWIDGNATWTNSADLNIYEDDGTHGTSFEKPDKVYVESEEWDDPGTTSGGAFSNIHHETGHFVHYQLHGSPLPGPTGTYSHAIDMETTVEIALTEGFAEYIAYLTAPPDHLNKLQEYTRTYRYSDANGDLVTVQVPMDPEFLWRGFEIVGLWPAPLSHKVTGVDNAGDIVEGAIWQVFAALQFSTVFETMKKKPTNIHAFVDHLGELGYSASLHIALHANGIVYCRERFTGEFVQPLLPDQYSLPQQLAVVNPLQKDVVAGGAAVITFVKGDVGFWTERVPRPDLNLKPEAETTPTNIFLQLSPKSRRLGFKPAIWDNIDENFNAANWSWGEAGGWGKFDSRSLADGPYDLIIQSQNQRNQWDPLTPTFDGDTDSYYSKDERWLKFLQTWYDFDPLGFTPDHDGQVMVDNTPPQVVGVSPPAN